MNFSLLKKSPVFLLVLLFWANFLKAQKAPSGPEILAVRDTLLSKSWVLESVEEFGVKSKPSGSNIADAALFMLNKTVTITLNGKTIEGTWGTEKVRTYVIITPADGGEKLRLKIVTITKDELTFEYQHPDLIRTTYYFVPAKK